MSTRSPMWLPSRGGPADLAIERAVAFAERYTSVDAILEAHRY